MTMTKGDVEDQMVKGIRECKERNLAYRFQVRECTERERLRKQLKEQWAEIDRLVAERRINAEKLDQALDKLREILEKR